MADITAEQVAKAITEVRCRVPPKGAPITDTLGHGWQDTAPAYVTLSLIDADGWDDTLAALERWHAELVAAETLRKDPLAYADSPVWDDGPMPKAPVSVDDAAPERLKARREALGWSMTDAALVLGGACDERDIGHYEAHDDGCCMPLRTAYAAALSAAEAARDRTDPHWRQPPLEPIRVHLTAETAPEVVDVPQPVVKRCGDAEARWNGPGTILVRFTGPTYPGQASLAVPIPLLRAMLAAIDAQQPAPTTEARPEPHYKVGDWVRVVTGPNSSGRTTPIRVTSVTSAGYVMADGASWAAEHLAPAMDPALHETARLTIAALRSLAVRPLKVLPLPDDYMVLPGALEWAADSIKDASPRWAAQLESLLGDAP